MIVPPQKFDISMFSALVGPSLASLVPRVAAIKETRETKKAESKETVKESRKCEEHEAERKERERFELICPHMSTLLVSGLLNE